MKVNYDKYAKAGTLQLHLQKYDNKYVQEEKEISGEDIKVPTLTFQNEANGRKEEKRRSNSKLSNKQEAVSQQEQQKTVNNVNVEDEQELLAMCISLTSRVEGLKKQKYQHVVQEYQEQQRQKIQQMLTRQQKLLSEKYTSARKELTVNYQQQKIKLTKAFEQINKFKAAYSSILEELVERRTKMNKQYEQSILKVKQQKQKLIGEWKRSSNEQIIKVGLKST